MKTIKFSAYGLLVANLATALCGALSLAACNVSGFTDENVAEGLRCNPYASHNECGSGLQCTLASDLNGMPIAAQTSAASVGPLLAFCPENYCCAVDSNGNINSTNPNCQPGCNGGAAAICLAAGSGATVPACICAAVTDDTATDPACNPATYVASPDAGTD
jgi:hypothetical protein